MSHLNRNQKVKPSAVLLVKALALGLVLIFIGCESEPPQKAAPTVVRKKIGASDQSADTKTSEAKPKKTVVSKAATSKKTAAVAPAKAAASKNPPAKPEEKTSVKNETATAATPEPASGEAQQAAPAKSAATAEPAADTRTQVTVASATQQKSGTGAEDSGSKAGTAPGKQPLQMASAVGRPPVIIVDPFEPLFKEETPEQKRPAASQPERPRRIPQTPLEKIDLGQLKLTAIIRTPVGNKALVEESSGKGYIIQKGTWIGVHAGRVQEITDDAVVVEEEIENALGEISLTKRELKLQKPPGE